MLKEFLWAKERAQNNGFASTVSHSCLLCCLQKAIVMKLRVSFKSNGQNNLEQAQVNNFPAGL
jgi:hypothetical protein